MKTKVATEDTAPETTESNQDKLLKAAQAIGVGLEEIAKADRSKRIPADIEEAKAESDKPAKTPGIRRGEDPLTERGFSFVRLINAQLSKDWSNAKAELEVANELRKFGYEPENGGMVIPMDSKELESRHDGLKGLAEKMTKGYLPTANMAKRMGLPYDKAMGTSNDPLGGVLVDADLEIIDLLRANVVLEQAGARALTFPRNGKLSIARETAGVNVSYTGENQPATESDPNFDDIKAVAHQYSAAVRVSNQMINRSSANLEAFLREKIGADIALFEDLQGLRGAGGSDSPVGIQHWPNIGNYTLINDAGNGGALVAEDASNIVDAVEDVNAVFEGFIMRSKVRNKFRQLRADAVTAGDGAGNFLFMPSLSAATPGELLGHPVFVTSQIPINLVKGGSAATMSEIYAGMFSKFAIIRGATLEIKATQEGEGTFLKNQTLIAAFGEHDFAVLTESAICFVDGVQAA